MKKLVLMLLTVFILGVFGCSGDSLNPNNWDITDDDALHASLSQQIADLGVKLGELQTDLDALTNVSAEADAALQAQIDVLVADLEALEARVAANEEDIEVLQGAVGVLETRVDDVESRLAVLEAYLVKVNAPLFASIVITETAVWHPLWPGANPPFGFWKDEQDPGATIVWTASAGGDVASSYNVYAVPVNDNGALGLPFKIANGTGAEYFFNGHLDEIPVGFDNGPNPTPLTLEGEPPELPVDTCEAGVYRFAVTAVGDNGNESAPAITTEAKMVIPSEIVVEEPQVIE